MVYCDDIALFFFFFSRSWINWNPNGAPKDRVGVRANQNSWENRSRERRRPGKWERRGKKERAGERDEEREGGREGVMDGDERRGDETAEKDLTTACTHVVWLETKHPAVSYHRFSPIVQSSLNRITLVPNDAIKPTE